MSAGQRENESALDLGRARFVRSRGVESRFPALPVAERLRAARGVPQAVVKVTSYTRSIQGVGRHLTYISRNGRLSLETETGESIEGREEQKALVRNWSIDFDARKNSRDTANIVFSAPPGSNVDALRRAVRATVAKSFAGHESVFAIHEDRNHPHAHLMVKMRGIEDDRKLRLNKPQLYRLREVLAEAAREQGIELAASPRAARGVGRKALRQSLYHLRGKGITPQVEQEAIKELKTDLTQRDITSKPWEQAIAVRNESERKIYKQEAAALKQAAGNRETKDAAKLLAAATELETFAKTMKQPQTRREAWLQKAQQLVRGRSKEQNRDTMER